MGRPLIGDVVVIPFPYADLSGSKRRPAVVIGHAERGDIILCQITSRPYASTRIIPITVDDFEVGGLPLASVARPTKVFTASASIVERVAGRLRPAVAAAIRQQLVSVLTHQT